MGLDVGMLSIEQFLSSLYCQTFDGIYIGAAGIIAVLWVTLGILIG